MEGVLVLAVGRRVVEERALKGVEGGRSEDAFGGGEGESDGGEEREGEEEEREKEELRFEEEWGGEGGDLPPFNHDAVF